ncbi:MAG: helical backbone metal receptor [Actinomycetota bacterium]
MKKKLILAAIVIAAVAASVGGKALVSRNASDGEAPSASASSTPNYNRIVSLAPNITEVLFELGLGNKVVGVTTYCLYPPAARDLPEVGGYSTPNYEAIAALNADLVVMGPEHEEAKQKLATLGIETLTVRYSSVAEILDSIRTIGQSTGVQQKAKGILADIREKIEGIRERTEDLPRPRTMISIGRGMGSGTLKEVYVAGPDTFYDDLVDIAGGVNAYQGGAAQYPSVSAEGILRWNPQVIIDVVPELKDKGWTKDRVLKEWRDVAAVDAVKNGQVSILDEEYVAIPGPRFVLTLELIARAIHPEVDWGS